MRDNFPTRYLSYAVNILDKGLTVVAIVGIVLWVLYLTCRVAATY